MLGAQLANSIEERSMPGMTKILTTAAIVVVVLAIVNRVPALKNITG